MIKFCKFHPGVAAVCLATFSFLPATARAQEVGDSEKEKPSAGSDTNRTYRFQKGGVALESASDLGLTYDDIAPASPMVWPRPRPLPEVSQTGRQADRKGSIAARKIDARLVTGEANPGEKSQAEFGFPLPVGGLFDPRGIRILDSEGREIPSQVSVSSYWPDDSIRWALIRFPVTLAGAETRFGVEFGHDISRGKTSSPLGLSKEGDIITVRTGAIEARIDSRKFNLLQDITLAGGKGSPGAFPAEGIILTGPGAKTYSTASVPPSSVTVDEGPERIVIRVEGSYADREGHRFMRYVTRLAFTAGSSSVTISHRHINDVLEREFTDFESLEIPFATSSTATGAQLLLPDGRKLAAQGNLSVFQFDETGSRITDGDRTFPSGRSPGVLEIRTDTGKIGLACREFWQRWPKSLGLNNGRISVGLLPKQPGPDYGAGLPSHLIYPFVDGKYRMKWGMSFTETVTFDFGGVQSPESLAAAVNDPPIAILPSAWYEETKALGAIAAQDGGEFAEWDDFFHRGYQSHMRRREQNREYGFMNYGDWFGERGRNWGNNEYDIAHAFFLQFARTGRPEYFRVGLAAARHQADVDIVHAYPDPAYVGANPQHSIGHTGQWSEANPYSTWSHRYDSHTDANNGHTWAEGMTEAWYLTGEPNVMESALMLGEHITWAVAPKFKISVDQPRSAGWSLRAILALYRATTDPEYLKAADLIARSAMAAQDESGIWIRDYTKSRPPTGGNAGDSAVGETGVSNFQLGLTLAGLSQYYDITKDAAARDAVLRGARLLAKAWPGSGGWPYDIRPDGTASPIRPRQLVETNIINAESVAYMGVEENDAELLRVAEEVLENTLFYQEPVATRQRIGILLRSGPAVLGALRAGYRKNGGEWPGKSRGIDPVVYFKGIPYARKFEIRGPAQRTFLLKTQGGQTTVKLHRRSPGLHRTAVQSGKIRLSKLDGTLIHEDIVKLDAALQSFPLTLPAEESGKFRLEIMDSTEGVWNLDPNDLAGALMETTPGFILSAVSAAKYAIFVPEGTESMTVDLVGIHKGAYGAALLDEKGNVLGLYRNANIGGDLVGEDRGGQKDSDDRTTRGKLAVTLKPGQTGRVLPLVLWADNSLEVQIQGVPPYLARNPEECFQP